MVTVRIYRCSTTVCRPKSLTYTFAAPMMGDCVDASTSTKRVAMDVNPSMSALLFAVHRIVVGFPPLDHAPCSAKFKLLEVNAAVVVPSVGAVPGTPDEVTGVVQVFAEVVDMTAVDAVTVVPTAALFKNPPIQVSMPAIERPVVAPPAVPM